MTKVFVMKISTLFLLTLQIFPFCLSENNENEDDKKRDVSDYQKSNQINHKDFSLVSSFLPLASSVFPYHSTSDIEKWGQDYVHDIDDLEAILGGPLKGRKFVTLVPITSSQGTKTREVPYRFRTVSRKKRDVIKELKKDVKTHPISLNTTMVELLQKTPEGFNSNTIYYHHTIRIPPLEQIQETKAILGSECETKSILDPDFCERAAYPNKNKMVCSTVTIGNSIKENTCMCKFYRADKGNQKWKQMRTGEIQLIDGQKVKACLVPAFGVCDHRLPTGVKDLNNNNIYEIDVCKGHYQCDNTKFLRNLVNKSSNVLKVTNHCSESDFLALFEEKVRNQILLCSKPHPRRFLVYDEFKYYCLPKKSRDPEQWHFRKPPSEEEEKDRDLFFADAT